MLDVLHSDSAARRVKWEAPGDLTFSTPLVLWVDTPRFPAPEWADVLLASRPPAAEKPWVLDRGSRFAPGDVVDAERAPFLTLEPDLPFSAAAGEDLQAAGDAENRDARAEGEAFVALAPEAPPEGAPELVAVGGVRALFEDPWVFAKRVTALRAAIGPRRLAYAPGCGRPEELALLAYAGFDVFDSAPALLAASKGELLTPEGGVDARALADAGLLEDASREALVRSNLEAVRDETARVHRAIALGKLRELVEQRIRARPELAANLRRFDRDAFDYFEERAPLTRATPLYATSKESLDRPEVERYRRRIESRYARPESASVLVILPCSARKPYSTSRTHRTLDRAMSGVRNRAAVHEVILTSPMGVVPRELERVYPAAHYDLPVTGHWDEDEKAMIRAAVNALVERGQYDRVVVHLTEPEMEIVAPVLGEFAYTAAGDPLAPASLDRLRDELSKAAEAAPRVHWGDRTVDDLRAIATWQFGPKGADALMAGTQARGRWPYTKVLDRASGEQVAMLTPDRGLLALTLEGGRRLLDAGVYRVEIHDFRPKGTVFAVGVTGADAEVRVDDDVVMHHAGKIKGVGRAAMPGVEMARAPRGPAVVTRHTA